MSLSARIKIHATATKPLAATAYSGDVTTTVDVDQAISNGTGANQATKRYRAVHTIAASSTNNVDLTTITDEAGTALAFTRIVAIVLEAATINGGEIEITPNATNGWTSLIKAAGDALKLEPGSTTVHLCPTSTALAVGASNKVLDLTNTDSGAAALLTITIIGS